MIGAYVDCSITDRLLYPFLHANIIHLALNAWCLLTIIFIYNVSTTKILLAYITAVTVPNFVLTTTPTIGLSAVVYTLFGIIALSVKRKLYYQICIAGYIALGYLFPNVNANIHLYCYIIGLLIAIITTPIICNNKYNKSSTLINND